MDNLDKVLKKIKALLAKAQSTDNLAEKTSFMMKAHELMAKYNVSVESSTDERSVIKQVFPTATKGVSSHLSSIAITLAEFCRVKLYLSRRGVEKELMVLGYEDDVKGFCQILSGYYKIYNDFAKKTLKGVNAARLAKNDFLVGFCKGLKEALSNNVAQYSLVVTTPDEVNAVYNNMSLARSKSNKQFSYNKNVEYKGYEAGLSVKNRGQIN